MAFSDSRIETTKRLAAQRLIDAAAEWYDFLSWGVAKGHWPTLPSMK